MGRATPSLGKIPAESKEAIPDKRKDRELIEEILQYTRNQSLKETKIIRLRKMTESEFRKMNNKDLIEYIQNAISRTSEGIAPSEMVQMKRQIILAAMILIENFPAHTEIAERQINSFPGIEKPILK